MFRHNVFNNLISVVHYCLQNIWLHSESLQCYCRCWPSGKVPYSIDKLSNLADSRRYLRNALSPYNISTQSTLCYRRGQHAADFFRTKAPSVSICPISPFRLVSKPITPASYRAALRIHYSPTLNGLAHDRLGLSTN
jgi:hypothetical protein